MSYPTQTMLLTCLVVALPVMGNAQICHTSSIPASTPTAQFINHGNGTVTDTKTGLMWKKCAEGQEPLGCIGPASGFTWQAALQRVQEVNSGMAGHTLGYTDWRVPNIKELTSIVEGQCIAPAINLAVFPNPAMGVWSSSPTAYHDGDAWYVIFSSVSDSGWSAKGSVLEVRLVRDAQNPSSATNPFTVQAADEVGTAFTVPEGKTQCTFTATGTWKWDAPSPAVTPDGGGPAYSGFRIPTGNAFGLIMQRADNTLEHTGASRTVDVSGNEVLHFMMNDVPGAYSDNSGSLSVSWSCQ